MVSLVDDQPMRSAGPRPHGGQMRLEIPEIAWPIGKRNTKKIPIRVHVRISQRSQDLGDAGCAQRIEENRPLLS
jgi:hypothetical protein